MAQVTHAFIRSFQYSGREIDGLESKIDENVTRFCEMLGSFADKGKAFDLGQKVQYFTLDVISDIAFGEPFGFLETNSDVYKYIETTEQALPMVMVTTVVPSLVKVLASPLLKSALPSDKDVFGFGRVMRYVYAEYLLLEDRTVEYYCH